MFDKLQAKWKVKGWQLAFILTTFTIGGSLTGYAGRKLLSLIGMEQSVLYYIAYILLMTIIWPIAVLIVSIPLGQYAFFRRYIKKIMRRMSGHGKATATIAGTEAISQRNLSSITNNHQLQTMPPRTALTNIAIFASGGGSNAKKIIYHFRNHDSVSVALVVSNKPNAGVLQIAEKEGIATLILNKADFFNGHSYTEVLKNTGIEWIVLAGFLWKVPPALIQLFPNKIINIHPALLPKYGGKGMYGHFVHEAVVANGETESGITIHYVDEAYDHGSTIFQTTCPVLPEDDAATLSARVLSLEHLHFAKVIEDCVVKNTQSQ